MISNAGAVITPLGDGDDEDARIESLVAVYNRPAAGWISGQGCLALQLERAGPASTSGGAFFVVIRVVIDGHLLAHLGGVTRDFFS